MNNSEDFFINVYIPIILSKMTNYYIKGGRAFNIYFKKKVPTIDWDIVTDEEGYNKIKDEIVVYINRSRELGLISNYNHDFNMYQHGILKNFVIDISITDISKIKYNTIGYLNYMKLHDLKADIILTLNVRKNIYERYINSLNKVDEYKFLMRIQRDYGCVSEIVYDIDTTKDTPFQTMMNFIIENLPIIELNISTDEYEDLIVNINKFKKKQDIIDYLEKYDDGILLEFHDFLPYIDQYYDTVNEFTEVNTKYIKTEERYNILENISYDSVSDDYKFFLAKKFDYKMPNDKYIEEQIKLELKS